MTDHPILFNSDMVLAIMTCAKCGAITIEIECPKCGSKKRLKTQTRRIIKNMPNEWHRGMTAFGGDNPHGDEEFIIHGDCGTETIRCRYPVGDLLWVRETLIRWCESMSLDYPYYAADKTPVIQNEYADVYDGIRLSWLWKGNTRPSIFMPKWACRNWLKVKSNRVEQVQDITRSAIRAEGLVCPKELGSDDLTYNYKNWYVDEWIKIWDSIYAAPKPCYAKKVITRYESYPWEDIRETREHRGKPWHVYGNPHVFATEFERYGK